MDQKIDGLSIDWETADRITILNLKDSLANLIKEVENLESSMDMEDLPEYKRKEYLDSVGYLRAHQRVLKYLGEV